MNGWFVTGTDTGVGKSLVSAALLHALGAQGLKVAGMKPIAAGAVQTPDGHIYEDVEILRRHANIDLPLHLVNPYSFLQPVSPHIGAHDAALTIEPAHIRFCYDAIADDADAVIVEGAGGFRAPIGPRQDFSDIAVALELPVILVVGVRLGCLNHTLLTVEAIAARGLRLASWVANRIDPEMLAAEDNIAHLADRLQAPLLGDLPFQTGMQPEAAAGYLDTAQLFR